MKLKLRITTFKTGFPMTHNQHKRKLLLTATLGVISTLTMSTSALAAKSIGTALTISQDTLTQDLKEKIYRRPTKTREITPTDIITPKSYGQSETLVGRKITSIANELSRLQKNASSLSERLAQLEGNGTNTALSYYANIANINAQLQSGTPPGNPRLVVKLNEAEQDMAILSSHLSNLNELGFDISHISSEAEFLLEETRASYSISGAIEEDHVNLAKMEDHINSTVTLIDRILNQVNDNITRTSAYLSSERKNLRTLSLAVANGELYGKNLTMRPFSAAPAYAPAMPKSQNSKTQDSTLPSSIVPPSVKQDSPNYPILNEPRPLAKIQFDRQDVDYEQPVYMAVSQALEKYPDVVFDLIAVHPSRGNAAQKAIESTRSRRNAERVLRTLTQMGLPLERIHLSYNESDSAQCIEVHLFIR